ncbi:MAG: hypothetical protein JRE28_15255 [Deltaproteobacteria bacterium]|nr:hypothetical protein [Deltaproteobacteria bacterium]
MEKLIKLIPLLAYYPQGVGWTIIGLLIGALILVVIAIVLFCVYYSSAIKTKKHVAHIEFRNESPFIDNEEIRNLVTNKGGTVYYYSVKIINNSDESAIRVRHLKISDLRILEGNHNPWENTKSFIVDWNPNKPKTIPPKDKVLARFARVYPVDLQQILDSKLWTGPHDIPQLRFISFQDTGRMTRKMISKVPEGAHCFKLTAYFDNVPPAAAKFELKCPPEKGRTTAEALVKEIKIEMLKPKG